jgi:hypothetical protein
VPSEMHGFVHKGRAFRTALAVTPLALLLVLWLAPPSAAVEPADPSVPADAVSWVDRSGVRAVTEALATNPQYSGNYLSWTGITIGSLRTELAVTPEFVASTGPATRDQLPVAEYIAPVFAEGQPIVAVGFRRAADGSWELGPQIYPAAVGERIDALAYGVIVLHEQTTGAWFTLEGDALRPMGPKSAALFGDGPVDLTTLRDRLAQGPNTPTAAATPPEADVSPTAQQAGWLGPWFWITLAAGAVLVAAILLQLVTVRRRRRRRRRHIRRLA